MILQLQNLFRIRSWWNYIVPPVLASVYFVVLMKGFDFSQSVSWTLLWLVSIIGTAIFGFLINNIFDAKTDAKSGKDNLPGKLSAGRQAFIVVFSLCVALTPLFFLKLNMLASGLLMLQFLLLILYSVPPFRVKRNIYASVIFDSLYSGLIFIFAVIFADGSQLWVLHNAILLMAASGLMLLMKGIRNILLHQIDDSGYDKKSGIVTFALQFGHKQALAIIKKVAITEIFGILIFTTLLSLEISYWFLLVIPGFVLYFFLKQIDVANKIKGKRFFLNTLNDYYEDFLPLGFLILLSVMDLRFLIILGIHVLIFQNKVVWFFAYRVLYVLVYRKALLWLYFKIFRNRYVKKIFLWNLLKSKNTKDFIFFNYNATRNKEIRKYICNAPFTNMYFDVSGNVVPCWQGFANPDSYPGKTVSEIWFGDKFGRFRQNIIKRNLEDLCGVCLANLKNGNYVSVLSKAYDFLGKPQKHPLMMELELDNTCNLECIMCNGMLSSSIRKNRDKKPAVSSPYNHHFVEELNEFIPHLKEIRFNGGEPFLSKICMKILENVFRLNPELKIVMATNGTQWNEKIEKLLEKGNIHINISIDSLDKTNYESIRVNSNFDMVMQNFELFLNYCRKKRTKLCVLVNPMRQNWKEMGNFVEFCNNHNVSLWFNTVQHPLECSIWGLSANEIQEIYETLSREKHHPSVAISESYHNCKVFNNLVKVQVYNWLMEARQREADYLMRETNPKSYFYEKIRNYIDKHIPTNQREKDTQIIMDKMNGLEAMLSEQNFLPEQFYALANNTSPELIYAELLSKNQDELLELVNNYLKK